MFPNVEQYLNSSKALMQSQASAFQTLAGSALESAEKVATLNLAAMKASAQDFGNVLTQASTARDPQAFFALVTSQFQPNNEKAASYARYLGEIFTETQQIFAKTAEAQVAEVSRAATAIVDQFASAAPAGSSDAMALVKSMMGTANAVYEQVNKVAKQTGEAMQAQAASLSGQFVKPVQAAANQTVSAVADTAAA
ncbi:MAG TPA: phasin family protein [Noviherbaspirillum sp.]|jgi:phasin family protein